MNPLAGQGVQVSRQGRCQGFSFSGLHLCNASLVQHDAAQNLHGEMTHPEHTVRGFPAGSKCVRENIVQGFSVGKAFLECGGLCFQFCVGHGTVFFFPAKDGLLDWADPFKFTFAVTAKKGGQDRFHEFHLRKPPPEKRLLNFLHKVYYIIPVLKNIANF